MPETGSAVMMNSAPVCELTAARFEFPKADFRTLQIQQNGGKCAGFPGQRADCFDARLMLLARAVGGVQAEDVHAGGEQLPEQRVAGRPERGHDLCVSSQCGNYLGCPLQ